MMYTFILGTRSNYQKVSKNIVKSFFQIIYYVLFNCGSCDEISVCFFGSLMTTPMFKQPPITRAVCDDPSFLIYPQTKWCYSPNTQVFFTKENISKCIYFIYKGPCKTGELFVRTGEGNIGKCK